MLVRVLITAGFLLSVSITPQAQAATPTCFGQTATIVGTNNPETITGTAGGDVIVALGGNDTIYGAHSGGENDYICGSGGDDLIHGQGGDDYLNGGDGNDRLFGGTAYEGDLFVGGPGNDRFTAKDNVYSDASPDELDYSNTSGSIKVNIANRTVAGAAGTDFIVDPGEFLVIYGTRFNDVFKDSTSAGPEVEGMNGDDTFIGGPQFDSFYGGPGSDTMHTYGGDDNLIGGTNAGRVAGVDYLDSGSGNDNVYSYDGTGDDTILAGDGDDDCFVDVGDIFESCERFPGEG